MNNELKLLKEETARLRFILENESALRPYLKYDEEDLVKNIKTNESIEKLYEYCLSKCDFKSSDIIIEDFLKIKFHTVYTGVCVSFSLIESGCPEAFSPRFDDERKCLETHMDELLEPYAFDLDFYNKHYCDSLRHALSTLCVAFNRNVENYEKLFECELERSKATIDFFVSAMRSETVSKFIDDLKQHFVRMSDVLDRKKLKLRP